MNTDHAILAADPGNATEASHAAESLLARFAHTFGHSAQTLLGASGWVTYIVGAELRIKHFLALDTDPVEQLAYEQQFAPLDPLAPAACLAAGQWVAHLQQQLSPSSSDHQAYRNGFLAPHRIADAIEIFLQSDAGLILGCSLLRHDAAPHFDAADLDKARAMKALGDFAFTRIFPRQQASLAVIKERFPALTARESMLVQLVAAGLNNKQLCRELNISLPTVKTHLLNIFRKLGVGSRTELVAKVLG